MVCETQAPYRTINPSKKEAKSVVNTTMPNPVAVPPKVLVFLTRKAKQENTTLSQAFASMMEDMIEYAEEGHIWQEALEREKTCTGELIPNDEFWKLADEIPYTP